MASLFVAEEPADVSEAPAPSGLLASSIAQTRAGRSASAAAPPSGLGRVFSSSGGAARQPEQASLTSPFEDRSGPASIAASAPGRSGLAGVPPSAPSFRGITVGQALLAVLAAARERDASEDAAVDAMPVAGEPSAYCLRVAETEDDDEEAAGAPEHEAFGACGAPLAGPWAADLDFPPLDAKALLSSIGIATFVVAGTAPAPADGGGLTQLDVVAAGEAEADEAGADTGVEGGADAGVPVPPSLGPWAGSAAAPLLRVRLPPASLAAHAGELRDGRPLTLVVERPSADGTALAARFTVSVDPSPAGDRPADAMTEAPSAAELASSLLSGLVMPDQ